MKAKPNSSICMKYEINKIKTKGVTIRLSYIDQPSDAYTIVYTNLYDWTTRSHSFGSKISKTSEKIEINYQIRDCIAFTQNRKGRWGLTFLYISTSIVSPFLFEL